MDTERTSTPIHTYVHAALTTRGQGTHVRAALMATLHTRVTTRGNHAAAAGRTAPRPGRVAHVASTYN